MYLGRKAQPFENGRRTSFRGVAVEALDRLFELAEPLVIEVVLTSGENRFLLDECVPELRVAHERHAEDLFVLVREVILLQDTEPKRLRDRHLPVRRIHRAREDVEQCRLS